MINMHKRAKPHSSTRAICGVELAERNTRRFLTTADRHVNCKRCRKLIAEENQPRKDSTDA